MSVLGYIYKRLGTPQRYTGMDYGRSNGMDCEWCAEWTLSYMNFRQREALAELVEFKHGLDLGSNIAMLKMDQNKYELVLKDSEFCEIWRVPNIDYKHLKSCGFITFDEVIEFELEGGFNAFITSCWNDFIFDGKVVSAKKEQCSRWDSLLGWMINMITPKEDVVELVLGMGKRAEQPCWAVTVKTRNRTEPWTGEPLDRDWMLHT